MTAVLQNLDQFETALERAGLEAAPLADLLARVRTHAERYTRLEEKLAGGVGLDVPLHLLDEGDEADPAEPARRLARRERDRLELGEDPLGGMRTLLERQGLKVYLPAFPAGAGIDGFFLFDRTHGPLFVADGGLDPDRLDHALARLYGHFLFDHDPYSIRLVPPGPEAGAAEQEASERAGRFATFFLVSPEGLARYLAARGWNPETGLPVSTVRELALFFEMAPAALLERLVELGLPGLPAGEDLADEVSPGDPPAPGSGPLSERFLRLALEAHDRGYLDESTLAEHLETDRGSARRLAARFRGGTGEGDPGDAPRLDSPKDDG